MYETNFISVKEMTHIRLDLIVDREETKLDKTKLKENIGKILSYIHAGDIEEKEIKDIISQDPIFISKYFTESDNKEDMFLEIKRKRNKLKSRLSDEKLELIRKTYHYIYDIEDISPDDLDKIYDGVRSSTPNFQFELQIEFTQKN